MAVGLLENQKAEDTASKQELSRNWHKAAVIDGGTRGRATDYQSDVALIALAERKIYYLGSNIVHGQFGGALMCQSCDVY